MKTIVIILGLTAGQIQERSSMNLDITTLYDYDARCLRGPLAVRYQLKNTVIDLPESELVGVSFTMGILTSADVTPHRKPMDAPETAKLCQVLEKEFLNRGFVSRKAKRFKEFTEDLNEGREPTQSTPPWRFGWSMGDESVNIVIRKFESASATSSDSDSKRYTIMLEFGNSAVAEMADKRMNEMRAKYFPNRQGRIPLAEYPKE